MNKVLVTGGAGFLGTHICDRLLHEGNHVYCLDNFYTGSNHNIKAFLESPNFTLIEHDISQPIDIQIDEIYNFACPASPPHYQADPIRTLKTSVIGTLNMLELAGKCGAKLIQASTSEVYGDPQVHPQSEDYWGNVNCTGIRACYDEGKRAAETLVYDFQRQHGLDVRVVRIFNTYGPGMNPLDGRVVSNFIVQALRNEPITVYGDGSQTRSFCYRDDLVEGIIRLMQAPSSASGPMNIGNPTEFTILQLAHIVIELTNSKSNIVHVTLPQDDPLQRCPDISKARAIINWEPKIELREGIEKTIQYFKNEILEKNYFELII